MSKVNITLLLTDIRPHIGDDKLRARIDEALGSVKYGCHCDLEEHMEPDGCVLDEGRPTDCIYAQGLVNRGQTKFDCQYWQPIMLVLNA